MTKTHEDRWRAFVGAVAPACDALPDLSEADFTKLVDDVGRHGIREAAIYWQPTESDNTGRCLVSGRHRYRANEALGKSPDEVPSRTVFGGNPLDWAVSLDVRRRHLTAVEQVKIMHKMHLATEAARLTKEAKEKGSEEKPVFRH